MCKKDREELKVSAAKINTTKTNSAKQRDIPANKKFQGIKNEADDNYPDKGQHKKSEDKKRQPKGKGIFECAFCSKKFAYKENVKVHINTVHMVRKYSCKYCGKTYSRPQTLKGHIKVYHEGHRFKCTKTNCNESFQRKDQLKAHMMSHQGKYLFICSTCSKGYNHKSNYEAHCNTHLVKKPYKCGQCEAYSTNYSSDFKRHLKVCQVTASIKCPMKDCKGVFKCQAYLRDHLHKFHQQGDPIICPICGKTFWYFSSKQAHMKTHQK